MSMDAPRPAQSGQMSKAITRSEILQLTAEKHAKINHFLQFSPSTWFQPELAFLAVGRCSCWDAIALKCWCNNIKSDFGSIHNLHRDQVDVH